MDWQNIVLSAVPVVLGIAFIWAKVDKVLKAMKELGDVLTVIPKALDDKSVSADELKQIKIELAEALAAFKAILK